MLWQRKERAVSIFGSTTGPQEQPPRLQARVIQTQRQKISSLPHRAKKRRKKWQAALTSLQGFIFCVVEEVKSLSQAFNVQLCRIRTRFVQKRLNLLQKRIVFAVNEALLHAADATTICSSRRTNDLSPHLIFFWFGCSSLEGRPPTPKLNAVWKLCAQVREEHNSSERRRRRVSIFLIYIQTSCCLAENGEREHAGSATPMHQQHLNSWNSLSQP